jgi:hypothetical protein
MRNKANLPPGGKAEEVGRGRPIDEEPPAMATAKMTEIQTYRAKQSQFQGGAGIGRRA